MNTNNAPERVDPYAGTYFTKEIPQKNDLSIWAVGCDGDSHVADFTGSNARRMADEYRDWKNTMQPQVSESDEAVERALELVRMIAEYPHKTLHEAGLVAKAKEAYPILARHRQPAAVSADAVECACDVYRTILNDSPESESATDIQQSAKLIQSYGDACRLDGAWKKFGDYDQWAFEGMGRVQLLRWIREKVFALSPETVCGGGE